MNSVFITHTSHFLPNDPVNNDEIEAVLGHFNDQTSRTKRLILRNNGIQTRHYVIDKQTGDITHNNAQLTAAAIQRLARENLSLADIQVLACGTTIPDQTAPNHALMTQGELGLGCMETVATAGICLAGFTAFKYAYMSIACGQTQKAVCTGSEVSSLGFRAQMYAGEAQVETQSSIDIEQRPELAFEKDFLRWMLSDGAGAWCLQAQPNSSALSLKIDWLEVFSYAGEFPTCMYAGATAHGKGLKGWMEYSQDEWLNQSVFAVKQDVRLLNEHITPVTLGRSLLACRNKYGLQAEEIDWFLPHMSSQYFASKIDEELTRQNFIIPRERWFTNLSRCGNTGSASIYIMLDELFNSGRLEKGQKILLFVPESGRFSAGLAQLTVV